MTTIDLRTAMTVTVPDKAKVDHTYELKAGLNDVPPEVAAHWYVKKFTLATRRVPRVVVPSSARPRMLPPAAVAAMGDALKAHPVIEAFAAEGFPVKDVIWKDDVKVVAPAPAIAPVDEKAAKA